MQKSGVARGSAREIEYPGEPKRERRLRRLEAASNPRFRFHDAVLAVSILSLWVYRVFLNPTSMNDDAQNADHKGTVYIHDNRGDDE